MIKYIPEDTSVCFAELRDEISLGINLSLCPHRCLGCHSSYLQKDIGDELTIEIIDDLIKKNQGITCVLFFGGDGDKESLKHLVSYIKKKYNLRTGWYSGEDSVSLGQFVGYFDYIKLGSYKKEFGGLSERTTNQRLYRLYSGSIEDITSCFWK